MAANTEARFSSNFLDIEVDFSKTVVPADPMGNELLPPVTAQPVAAQPKSTNPFVAVEPGEKSDEHVSEGGQGGEGWVRRAKFEQGGGKERGAGQKE